MIPSFILISASFRYGLALLNCSYYFCWLSEKSFKYDIHTEFSYPVSLRFLRNGIYPLQLQVLTTWMVNSTQPIYNQLPWWNNAYPLVYSGHQKKNGANLRCSVHWCHRFDCSIQNGIIHHSFMIPGHLQLMLCKICTVTAIYRQSRTILLPSNDKLLVVGAPALFTNRHRS